MAYVSVLFLIGAVLRGVVGIRALVNIGCLVLVIWVCIVARPEGVSCGTALDGRGVEYRGLGMLDLVVTGISVGVRVVVMDSLVEGVDVVLGMELINQLGGTTICQNKVRFGGLQCSAAVEVETVPRESAKGGVCSIKDKDFLGVFNGECWTVDGWMDESNFLPREGQVVGRVVPLMAVNQPTRGKVGPVLDCQWMDEGIVLPWEGQVIGGVVPLMAVNQPTKSSVGLVVDYEELNAYVECHTGDDITDSCGEALQGWGHVDGELVLVDLKAACLRMRVAKELPVVLGSLTRGRLVSVSGKLVGRYLIVGWLRVACRNWVWLAVYIMYCGQLPFFTLVDCGPGGLAGWQELQGEAAVFGILLLGELFLGGESVAGNDKGGHGP